MVHGREGQLISVSIRLRKGLRDSSRRPFSFFVPLPPAWYGTTCMWHLLFVCILLAPLAVPPSGQGAEFGDIDLSVYMLGSWPRDQNVYNQGATVPASIQQGFGAGLKVGLFPHFTNRVIGIELDSFGHGGALSFPNSANGQNNGTGRSNLLILNTMFNLVRVTPAKCSPPMWGSVPDGRMAHC